MFSAANSGEYVVVHSENANEQKENKLFAERLMPENDLLTCIYREGKLPNNGTNIGIHRGKKTHRKRRIFRMHKTG